MQGLHLTGDLFGCDCSAPVLTDLNKLSTLCRTATLDAGLTIVDEKWHVFPDWNGQPGGITGTILLAESHLAIHTWPENRGVTLDVYVCNFTDDNTGKAEQLFDTLMMAFRPQKQVVNRITRGDLADASDGSAEAAAQAPGSTEPDSNADLPVAATAADATGVQQSQLSFEWLNAHSGFGFTVKEKLAEIESAYQRVEVFDTQQFGRLFRLDGRLMTSEGDEFHYHECMTHPAALAHPNPENVLVIGGGDGGSSEELFKHPGVRRIVMAELDPAVIDISRKYLGAIHKGALDDPRLEIRIGDGYEYVRSTTERFDLIVLDLTDPDTPAFQLYSEEFFRLCQRALKPGGLLTLHLGTPVYQPDTVRRTATALRKVFKHVAPLSLFIPLYGSQWCLATASDTIDPRNVSAETIAQRMIERRLDDLRFYHPAMHAALFTLPRYVQELVGPPAGARTAHLRAA